MSFVPEFMLEWWFMGLMLVVLIGLIFVWMTIRNKRDDDDDDD